jgi:hypothetical protein
MIDKFLMTQEQFDDILIPNDWLIKQIEKEFLFGSGEGNPIGLIQKDNPIMYDQCAYGL